MIPIRSGVRVWIATGHTDMRRGMNGLALPVQEGLKRDPHACDLFVFRGRRHFGRRQRRNAQPSRAGKLDLDRRCPVRRGTIIAAVGHCCDDHFGKTRC